MTKRGYTYQALMLTTLATYVLNTVKEGVQLTKSKAENAEALQRRQIMEQRLLEVTKRTWPECVNLHMPAEACKDFIDNEIYSLFTEKDQYIRSIIIGKRRKTDAWSNSVVIPMNDNDMAIGRNGDAKIYYDFLWDGSGQLATDEQQSAIPPITAMEPTASLYPTDGAADPAPTEDPIIILATEIEGVEGATIDAYIAGGSTAPIAGGVLTDNSASNTPEGDAKIEDALSEPVVIEVAGNRTIPPIDCTGLTGTSCCLLVKLKVRDSDATGKAIQCSLDYAEGTEKQKFWLNHRGKKVHIFANHNGIVSKMPKIVGSWPNGIEGDEFTEWVRQAGSPPLILQY